jgi:hypothetical protein
MIELFACAPLSASISRQQCAINRESHISCQRCAGLGELVESFDGAEGLKVAPRWNQSLREAGQKGAAGRKLTIFERAAAMKDHTPLDEVGIEAVDTQARTISFDVVDVDDLSLLRRLDEVIYGTGLTIGDEIMLRLRLLEEHL